MNLEQGLELVSQLVRDRTGTPLSAVELAVLRGAWSGQNYEAIAETTNYSVSYLSRTLAPQLWQRLSTALGEAVTKKSFRTCVERLVAQNSTGKLQNIENDASSASLFSSAPHPTIHNLSLVPSASTHCDWGEAIDVSIFYGRTQELETLTQWIVSDRCRLIAIVGMGGMGKTALSVKLAQRIQQQFEFVVWRSLRNAPPLSDLLAQMIALLSNQQDITLPDRPIAQISKLIQYFRQYRCLVVLDNAESILQSGVAAGHYLAEYEAYGELLHQIGESQHQSCLVLTSREKPAEVAALEGESLPVRVLQLPGLPLEEGTKIFNDKGLSPSRPERQRLIQLYRGNPLALKIVSTSIRDLFDGDIAEFLHEGTAVFNGIRILLDQQFNRLTALEQQVMYWLAINRDWMTLADLRADISPKVTKSRLLETLEYLGRRSLIEKSVQGFTQQPVVMEYMIEKLLEQVFKELTTPTQPIVALHHYALTKATAKEYVRESQVRFILEPLVERLQMYFQSEQRLQRCLQQVLEQVRAEVANIPGYSTGNLLNLLCHLKVDLTGYDFSHLYVWQAYLVNTKLQQVNFTGADLSRSVFAEAVSVGRTLTFSWDSELLATSDVFTIRVWSVATGQQLLTLHHANWIWRIAFSPDGKLLATSSIDQVAKIWDVATGECLHTLEGEVDGCFAVTFSPDGRWLIGSGDLSVKVWDTVSWQQNITLTGHTEKVIAVACSKQPLVSGGYILASSSYDRTIKLWDSSTGNCLYTLEGHTAAVFHIIFSPDDQLLSSASADHTIQLWEVATGRHIKTLEGHKGVVPATTFITGHNMLASCSFDRTIRLWNLQTGQCFKTLQGHAKDIWFIAASPNGQLLASNGDDKFIKLWDVQTGKCWKNFQGHSEQIFSIACSPDGSILASASDNKTIALWDISTRQMIKSWQGHDGWIWTIAFSPDGKLLASSGGDHRTKVWDVQTGKCLHFIENQDLMLGVAFSPDGQTLATNSGHSNVGLWDLHTYHCTATLEGHIAWIWGLAFSPDGQWLASISDDSTAKLWNPKTKECIITLTEHAERVWTATFTPDARSLVTGSDDFTAKLWDVSTGKCLKTFEGHTNAIRSVAVSQDSKLLATGSQDQTIRLWNFDGNCLMILSGHSDAVVSVTFIPSSSEDNILASGSYDGTIRLWNLKTADCLTALRPDRLYEGMNITDVAGLTHAQKSTLQMLGAG